MKARTGSLFAAVAAAPFLGSVSPTPAPSALFQFRCSSQQTVEECFKRYWYEVEPFTDDDSQNLFRALDAADWTGLDGDNAEDCQRVLDGVNEAYYGGGVSLWTGMPDWKKQEAAGDSGISVAGYLPHPDGDAILFHSEVLTFRDATLKQALHEAAHYKGIGHDDEFSNEDAEKCAVIPNNEDDDNPPDPGGTTCTEEEYTYTEWDWVWTEIEAGSCVGVSPVRWPWEEGGDDGEMHCTPARWGYVLMEVEKTGVRTVCVPTSN